MTQIFCTKVKRISAGCRTSARHFSCFSAGRGKAPCVSEKKLKALIMFLWVGVMRVLEATVCTFSEMLTLSTERWEEFDMRKLLFLAHKWKRQNVTKKGILASYTFLLLERTQSEIITIFKTFSMSDSTSEQDMSVVEKFYSFVSQYLWFLAISLILQINSLLPSIKLKTAFDCAKEIATPWPFLKFAF